MRYTKNYQLRMMEETDSCDVEDINDNMERVDEELGRVDTALLSKADKTSVEARLKRLEDALFHNITENPFRVGFEDIGEVTATGVWNESQKRMEC